jgi:hypothetical protein
MVPHWVRGLSSLRLALLVSVVAVTWQVDPAFAAPQQRLRAKPKASVAAPRPTPPRPPGAEAQVETGEAGEGAAVVKTEEARAGVKTYTFDAQEVEGRLRSPQILYFLRRVRAEFDPQPLGHRSFLLELADTRRHPALQ